MPLYAIQYAILGLAGLCIGSFFNVLIWRIPRGESIVWPPSHCTGCGGRIGALDNFPVVSYIALGGKCRRCGSPISPIYPIVELITAAVLVAVWRLLDINLLSPWYMNLAPVFKVTSILLLIPISVIDIRHYIIPDRFTLPFLLFALGLSLVPDGSLSPWYQNPLASLLGALAGGGTLFIVGAVGAFAMRKGDAMGMGDVKLMAYLGALWGYKAALLGIAFGSLLGSVVGGIMLMTKSLSDDHRIPFGPFLAVGTVIAVFAGEPLIRWYLSFF
ncbi:MAG: prepilin peptidase [Chitinispirillales bacterium]|jgi:leader peptidase (prepilin peptidase)/N-methyltransferase|nr:prepilin peptidase [Chitinispirillales bacterium]